MSDQDNVEIVQRFYKALFAGDIPATLAMATDDVDVFMFGFPKIPWTGQWRGRQELNRTTGDWHRDALADTSRVVRPLNQSARSFCAQNDDSGYSPC